MNLHRMLQERSVAGKPLRVALIGAGKFGAMYLVPARPASASERAPQRSTDQPVRASEAFARSGARSAMPTT